MIFGINKQQAGHTGHTQDTHSTHTTHTHTQSRPGGPFTGLVLALFERRRTLIFRNEFVYGRRMGKYQT